MNTFSNTEMIVYGIFVVTNLILIWHWANYGFFESGLLFARSRPLTFAYFAGIGNILVAGYLEKNNIVKFYLFKEENLYSILPYFFGGAIIFYLIIRYIILPKGVPEFNRARTAIAYWIYKYYRPAQKLPDGDILQSFGRARYVLDLIDKSIQFQRKGTYSSRKAVEIPINHEEIDYDHCISAHCPNCGMRVKLSVRAQDQTGFCVYCNCGLAYKIISDTIYLSAFGLNLNRVITQGNRINIIVALGEKGFLLRMMNLFEDAIKAFDEALLEFEKLTKASSPEENVHLSKIKSLIIFRKGETAHVLGDRETAHRLYKESLAIDQSINDTSEMHLVLALMKQVE